MSDEEKARAIWAAAAIKGAHPLDEPAAKKLGNKLASAAHLYRVALESSPREKERLASIERAAGKLSRLLDESLETRGRLDELWPACSAGVGLRHVSVGLGLIRKTARFARNRKSRSAVLRDIFDSPEKLFINRVASAYETVSSERAGLSRGAPESQRAGELYGPFARFIEETARQFDLKKVGVDTINAALRERRAKNG